MTNKRIFLLVLSWFLFLQPVLAADNIVAKPIEKAGYVLEISGQEGSEAEIKSSSSKFCLIVCFVKELGPNLAHIKRSILDLVNGASVADSAPTSIKNFGAALKEISGEILTRTELFLGELAKGLKDLARPVNEQRIIPKVSIKQVPLRQIATASLLDRLKQFLIDLLGLDRGVPEKISTLSITAIPLVSTESGGGGGVNVQPSRTIVKIQPTITNQVVDDTKLAALASQLDLFKKTSEQRNQELFQLIALQSQITNMGPRGNTPLTIGSPTFTGTVSGLTDASIPDDITVSSSHAGSFSGDLTVGGALNVTGAQTFTGGSNFVSNVGIGTTSPYAPLSVEIAASSKLPAFVVSDSGTSSPAFMVNTAGNVGIGTSTISDRLTVDGNVVIKGPRPYIDVRAYGAIGDGSADDTSAINAAISALPSSGGTIYFPPGNYLSKEIIISTASTTIMGAGPVSKITNNQTAAANVIRASANNITIRDLELVGNGVDATASAIPNGGVVLFYLVTGGTVEHVIAEKPAKNGLGIELFQASEIRVLNNVIQGGLDQSKDISVERNSNRNLIQGNLSLSPNMIGIQFLSVSAGETQSYNRIIGNYVTAKRNAVNVGTAHGIVLNNETVGGGPISKNVVSGNTINNIQGIGIYLAGQSGTSINVENVVTDNVIDNAIINGTGGTLTDGAISVSYALDALVENNLIVNGGVDSSSSGIRLISSNNSRVIGNRIKNFSGVGINVAGNAIVVSGNSVSGTVSSGIYIVSGNDNSVMGNTVVDPTGSAGGYWITANRTKVIGNAAVHTTLTTASGFTVDTGGTNTFFSHNESQNFSTALNDAGVNTITTENSFASIYRSQYNLIGFASSTPYAQVSIEANQSVAGSNTPIFVIGDQGTSAPLFIVSGRSSNSPFIGIGTSSPNNALEVAGYGVIKGNFNIEATSTASSFNATSTLSVGTSTPTSLAQFSVAGNSYLTGGLGIGAATTSPGGLFVKGSADVYDGIKLRGGQLLIPDGISTQPGIAFGSQNGVGIYRLSTGMLAISTSQAAAAVFDGTQLRVIGTGSISFANGAISNAADVTLFRDAANNLALRNSTNAQEFHIYNTFTNTSNLEYLSIRGDDSVKTFQIESVAKGTGIQRNLALLGGAIGIASTSPYGLFSIEATSTGFEVGSTSPIFVVSDSGSSTPFIYVSGNNGFVGIATASPGYTLGIGGFGVVKGNFNIEATSTASSFNATSTLTVATSTITNGVQFANGGNEYVAGGLGIGAATTSPGGLFVKGSADIYDGLIVRGGKLGIGTAAPATTLDVNGNVAIGGTTVITSGKVFQNFSGIAQTQLANSTLDFNSSGGATIQNVASQKNATLIIKTGNSTFADGSQIIFSPEGTEAARFMGNGAFGFGTTSPFGQVSIESVQGVAGSNTPIFVVGDSGTSSPFIYVSGNNGNTGFGTDSPQATVAIDNSNTGNSFPALLIKAAGTGDGNIAIAVDASDVCKDADGGTVGNCILNDLAELFRSSETMEAGDLAMIDPENPVRLKKATQDKRNLLAGVISTSPAIVFEGSGLKALGGIYQSEENKVPLTLSGRTPVKVNLEGGEIHIGDPITISSVPGVGTKATTRGEIIGSALQNYSGPTEENGGKVFILTNLKNWTDPSVILNEGEGSLIEKLWNALITKLTEWFQTAVLAIKELNTQKLCVGGTCITEAELKILLGRSETPTEPAPAPEPSLAPSPEPSLDPSPEPTPQPEAPPAPQDSGDTATTSP